MSDPGGQESFRYIADGMPSVGSAEHLCPTAFARPETLVEWFSSNSRCNQ
jgi:hypothetical protein